MIKTSFRFRIAGMIGNILEHYDSALFGLLAPFLAPLFFNNEEPIKALIMTYGMLPLGIISRPLGSLFFGWIGDRFGRRYALFYSLMGMAVITTLIGCLPLYRDVGIWAPILLAIGRLLQTFCTSGEISGGAIFVLEHTETSKRSFFSSIYDATTIIGILIASGLVTLFSSQNFIEEGWRILFWIGGFTAILGVFMRMRAHDSREFVRTLDIKKPSVFQILKEHKKPLVFLLFASGFTYTTYTLAFTLMIGFVPLVTALTKTEVMQINSWLLVYDMLLLPCVGYLASRIGKEKLMLCGALCSLIFALPLFYFLDQAHVGTVIFVRMLIVTFGVCFAAPYHAWTIERIAPQYRYTVISLGYSLGSQIIGAPTAAICIWLYHQSNWTAAPGIYMMVVSAFALLALLRFKPVAISDK